MTEFEYHYTKMKASKQIFKQASNQTPIRNWDNPVVPRLHNLPTKYMVTQYYTTNVKKLEMAREHWAQHASTYIATEWDFQRNYRNREEETPDYLFYYYMIARFYSMYPSMVYKRNTLYLDIYRDMKRWKEKYMDAFLEKNNSIKVKEDFAIVYHDIQLVVWRKYPMKDICFHILSYLL